MLVGPPVLGLVLGAAGLGTFWVVLLVIAGPLIALFTVGTYGRGGYVDPSHGGYQDPRVGTAGNGYGTQGGGTSADAAAPSAGDAGGARRSDPR